MRRFKATDTSDEEVSLMMMDLLSILTIVGVIMSVAMAVIMDVIPAPTGATYKVVGNAETVFTSSYFNGVNEPKNNEISLAFNNFEIYPQYDPESYHYRFEQKSQTIQMPYDWLFRSDYFADVAVKKDLNDNRYDFKRLYVGNLAKGSQVQFDRMVLLVEIIVEKDIKTEKQSLDGYYFSRLYQHQENNYFVFHTLADSTEIQFTHDIAAEVIKDMGFQGLSLAEKGK